MDQDFGGVHDSEEEEFLDLEEKDAIKRQKKQDSALDYVNFCDFDNGEPDESDSSLNFHVERNESIFHLPNKKSIIKSKRKSQNVDNFDKVRFCWLLLFVKKIYFIFVLFRYHCQRRKKWKYKKQKTL